MEVSKQAIQKCIMCHLELGRNNWQFFPGLSDGLATVKGKAWLLSAPYKKHLDDFTVEELINIDAKSVEKDENKFVIAQVNTVSIPDVLKRQEELEKAIRNEIDKKGLALFVLAITDILNSNSEIIALGNRTDAVEKAFEKELINNRMFLEGVVSRKKQLLPHIDRNI